MVKYGPLGAKGLKTALKVSTLNVSKIERIKIVKLNAAD